MSAGKLAAALGWFVVFAGLALVMGRSALGDWREGRREREGGLLYLAVEQWWATAVAAAVAVTVPVVLVASA